MLHLSRLTVKFVFCNQIPGKKGKKGRGTKAKNLSPQYVADYRENRLFLQLFLKWLLPSILGRKGKEAKERGRKCDLLSSAGGCPEK